MSPSLQDEVSSQEHSQDASHYPVDEKKAPVDVGTEAGNFESGEEEEESIHHPADKDDILTHTLHLQDDPTLSSLTFRTWFLGIGLAVFGGTISSIYYFKPQTVVVSTVFVAVIAYLMGEGMAMVIPRKGAIGRWLNPHPFNIKEHLAIIVMANSASTAALGIELLAVERLYYDAKLNGALSIFLLFSSQMLGYGLGGLMRKTLVYPKNMLWPSNIPVNNMLETLHRPRAETRKPLKVFGFVFTAIFLWEIVPEWIMPILTGVSIFCLANQKSAVFTNVFGGASGNEGLGLFSFCFDWDYISGGYSPLYYPMESLISQGVGVILCIVVFSGVYYGNIWNAQNFPFLSQVLFSENATMADQLQWNQTLVIGADNRIDKEALALVGLPSFAATYAVNILVSNMSISAGIVHMLLWNWNDMQAALSAFYPSNLKRKFNPKNWNLTFWKSEATVEPNEENYDPHYKLMMSYKPVPNWWYSLVLVLSVVIGLICLYKGDSTLPWWGFLVSCLVAWVFLLIFGAMQAVTGIAFIIQPIVQLIGGYIQPGNPVANMYFCLYGYNSVTQGALLCTDLKLAQYGHLAPRVTFTMQMIGTLVGAIFNYIMMNSIVTNQREILLSVEGTNIWSGQQPQQYNTLSVAWGGLAHELFSVGGRYEWCSLAIIVGFFAPLPFWLIHKKFPSLGMNNVNTSVMIYYVSYLCVGINSSVMMFFLLGFASQWYLRRYHPNLFIKYNYLVSAALDGGTSVIVFIMSFALFGAAGNAVSFPIYWGNNSNGNYDLCLYTD
ncbi:hypothetical protein ASPZODRAFT_60723 [Penicilliopsis zonata CBS 506.65]|uniref:OPT family small oligopeptide transporter n=1 Tax=Penicilliopsis zonata CBS 506.65 TaxID=1073090 RepID=A0A1L9SPV7_9EURO|nr:hypothetical protein ASPZODRAFT_60723 [Penicilliopsis zonata CBS 506.65]OJJ49265.1 hypothetical protein ASPZODRAFT_60723 [Penicilliopsis zonata CBS 506.65]